MVLFYLLLVLLDMRPKRRRYQFRHGVSNVLVARKINVRKARRQYQHVDPQVAGLLLVQLLRERHSLRFGVARFVVRFVVGRGQRFQYEIGQGRTQMLLDAQVRLLGTAQSHPQPRRWPRLVCKVPLGGRDRAAGTHADEPGEVDRRTLPHQIVSLVGTNERSRRRVAPPLFFDSAVGTERLLDCGEDAFALVGGRRDAEAHRAATVVVINAVVVVFAIARVVGVRRCEAFVDRVEQGGGVAVAAIGDHEGHAAGAEAALFAEEFDDVSGRRFN
mmetsp:Transcript_11891/g.25762  ORF Transcript_11891/g.25762 Transcript_11891/m.25762 type:complete len:274 (-) Transcript_11891:138-959(-)